MPKAKAAAPELDAPNPGDDIALDAPPSAEDDPMLAGGKETPPAEGPEGPGGEFGPEAPEEGDGPAGVKSAGSGAIQGRYNSSPVGDVKMTKVKGTYNTYKLELSMGQLEVILTALERNHDDAVSDELLSTFHFYLEKLPGPGEDEDEFDAKKEAEAGGGMEGDTPLPMPPGQEGGEPENMEALPRPGGAPAGGAGPEVGLPGDEGEEAAGAGGPPPPEDSADKRLPPPPKE